MSDPTPQHEVVSCVRSHAYVNKYIFICTSCWEGVGAEWCSPVVLVAGVDVGLGFDEHLDHAEVALKAAHVQRRLLPGERSSNV